MVLLVGKLSIVGAFALFSMASLLFLRSDGTQAKVLVEDATFVFSYVGFVIFLAIMTYVYVNIMNGYMLYITRVDLISLSLSIAFSFACVTIILVFVNEKVDGYFISYVLGKYWYAVIGGISYIVVSHFTLAIISEWEVYKFMRKV